MCSFYQCGLIVLLLILGSDIQADKLEVSHFSNTDLSEWQEKEFKGKTAYERIQEDGQWMLKATSKQSASALFLEKTIDLNRFPFVNWRWKIKKRTGISNEQVKAGDDYSARLYLIVDGGLFFWNTKALNYVWSDSQAKNSQWPNAFAPNNAIMQAVRTHSDLINHWYNEKRAVAKDFKAAFGSDIDQIDGIAIMTDSDNALGETESYFADIYFSSE